MTWIDKKRGFLHQAMIALILRPKENECLYAARMMASLMSRWPGLSTEQLAMATFMSHVAQLEQRAQKSGEAKPFLLFCYDETRNISLINSVFPAFSLKVIVKFCLQNCGTFV